MMTGKGINYNSWISHLVCQRYTQVLLVSRGSYILILVHFHCTPKFQVHTVQTERMILHQAPSPTTFQAIVLLVSPALYLTVQPLTDGVTMMS